MVSHWKLDEASGTRADSHGTNNLTDVNTVTSAAGVLGNAAEFTAANSERLSIASNATLQMGPIDFTLCAWVYLNGTGTSRTIMSKGNEYWLEYSSTGPQFRFAYVDSGGNTRDVFASTFGSPSSGSFNFVVAWYESATQTLYIQVNNGTVDSEVQVNPVNAAAGALFALGSRNGAVFHDGRTDAVGVWKRILTSDERTRLYNSGAGLDYPFFSTTNQSVSATGTFAATLSKTMYRALSATASWVATLVADYLAAFRPTVRIAEHPASDRTAEVPSRITSVVGSGDEE